MDTLATQALPSPITLPPPPAHAFGLPKDAISSDSPHSSTNGAQPGAHHRPPIGSTFYTSPAGKQGRNKRTFDQGPAAIASSAADPKSRRIGADLSRQAASQARFLQGGSSGLSSAGQVLVRSKAAEAEAARAEEQRLTSNIKDAIAGVQQATRSVSMPDAMK